MGVNNELKLMELFTLNRLYGSTTQEIKPEVSLTSAVEYQQIMRSVPKVSHFNYTDTDSIFTADMIIPKILENIKEDKNDC